MRGRHTQLFALLGLSLGTASLGNLWRLGASVWHMAPWVNAVTDGVCGVLASLAIVLWATGAVLESLRGASPFNKGTVMGVELWAAMAAGGMAVTNLSNYAAIVNTAFSDLLWYLGVTWQLIVLLGATIVGTITLVQRRGAVYLDDFSPFLYPITVGVGVATPTAAAAVVTSPDTATSIGTVLAWAACLFLVLVPPTVGSLGRALWRGRGHPQKAVPSAFIQMAPFGVAYTAYLHGNLPGLHTPTESPTLLLFLVGSLASSALVLPFLMHGRHLPAVAWASITFPLVSSARAMLEHRGLEGHTDPARRTLDAVAGIYVAAATAAVVTVWGRVGFSWAALAIAGETALFHDAKSKDPAAAGLEAPYAHLGPEGFDNPLFLVADPDEASPPGPSPLNNAADTTALARSVGSINSADVGLLATEATVAAAFEMPMVRTVQPQSLGVAEAGLLGGQYFEGADFAPPEQGGLGEGLLPTDSVVMSPIAVAADLNPPSTCARRSSLPK